MWCDTWNITRVQQDFYKCHTSSARAGPVPSPYDFPRYSYASRYHLSYIVFSASFSSEAQVFFVLSSYGTCDSSTPVPSIVDPIDLYAIDPLFTDRCTCVLVLPCLPEVCPQCSNGARLLSSRERKYFPPFICQRLFIPPKRFCNEYTRWIAICRAFFPCATIPFPPTNEANLVLQPRFRYYRGGFRLWAKGSNIPSARAPNPK